LPEAEAFEFTRLHELSGSKTGLIFRFVAGRGYQLLGDAPAL